MPNYYGKRVVLLVTAGTLFGSNLLHSSSFAATQSCVAPAPNLISWWRAENNTSDEMGLNDGTIVDDVTYAKGYRGRAFSFDGSNYVQVPNSPSLDLPNGSSITIQAWAFETSNSYPQHLVGKRSGCGGGDGFYQLAIGNGAIPPSSVPMNKWSHLAWTLDANTQIQTNYVNGEVVESYPPATWLIQNNAPLEIGGSGACAGFVGLIDEVAIYNRALSAREIQAIYAAGKAGQCLPQSSVAGGFTGLLPSHGSIVCKNLTTNLSVTIPLAADVRQWNCETAGLVVNTGDLVQMNAWLGGTAQ